jgi:hypothetical protein
VVAPPHGVLHLDDHLPGQQVRIGQYLGGVCAKATSGGPCLRASTFAGEARVEDIAQAVAEEVEAEHG